MRLAAIRKDPLARRDIGAATAPGRSAPVCHRHRRLRSAKGAPRRLLEAGVAGRVGLVTSDHLLSELSDVLHRPKFRRWLAIEHADTFVQAVALLGEHRADPDLALRQRLCRDPKDEYLIALAEDTDATFLVSGDSDLQAVEYGPVLVRDPTSALAALNDRHPWTIAAMRADSEEELWRRARAEGDDLVWVRLCRSDYAASGMTSLA